MRSRVVGIPGRSGRVEGTGRRVVQASVEKVLFGGYGQCEAPCLHWFKNHLGRSGTKGMGPSTGSLQGRHDGR